MTVWTKYGSEVDAVVLQKYFRNLVNMFFKILPMRENNEPSLNTYMESLQGELLEHKELIVAADNDASLLSLASILQFLMDHDDLTHSRVRREVFRAISICNKLVSKYSD